MKIDATYAKQQRKAVAEQLPDVVPAADAARLAGLTTALAVQTAQQSSLTIQRARAAVKYGAASDQVRVMDARLQTGAQAMQTTQLALTRAQLQAPSVPEGAAGIFGRVVDASGAGVRKMTILATSQAGTRSAKATSAEDGSFQMLVPLRGAEKSRSKSAETASAKSSLTVYLEVNAGEKTILKQDDGLVLQAGDIRFCELSIRPPTVKTRR